MFCWTDEKNDKATVQHLKALGIHGIIYDRMDQNNSKQVHLGIHERLTIDDAKLEKPYILHIQVKSGEKRGGRGWGSGEVREYSLSYISLVTGEGERVPAGQVEGEVGLRVQHGLEPSLLSSLS